MAIPNLKIQIWNSCCNGFKLDESFAQTALAKFPIAVKIVNSTDVVIEDNVLDGPGLNLERGITMVGSGSVTVKSNTVPKEGELK